MKTTEIEECNQTFVETVLDALSGKEGELVQFTSGANTIELCSTGTPIGVYLGKLQAGNLNCGVRLLTAEGTIRVKQAGAIPVGTLVKRSTSKVASAATPAAGQVLIGIKKAPATNGAAGDIIEIIPLRGVYSPVVPVATTAKTNGGSTAILALAVGGTYSQAEVQALRAQIAAVSADLEALRANLVTSGVASV